MLTPQIFFIPYQCKISFGKSQPDLRHVFHATDRDRIYIRTFTKTESSRPLSYPTCPPSFVRIRPQRFKISRCVSFWPILSIIEIHLKKILVSGSGSSSKSNRSCYTPSMPTKFGPNPFPFSGGGNRRAVPD